MESLKISTLILGDILDWGPPCTDFQPQHCNWLLPVKLHILNNFPSNRDSMKLSCFCTVPKVFHFMREKSPASASKQKHNINGLGSQTKTNHTVRKAPLSASGNAYLCWMLCLLFMPLCHTFKVWSGIWNPRLKVRHSLQIHIIWPVDISFFLKRASWLVWSPAFPGNLTNSVWKEGGFWARQLFPILDLRTEEGTWEVRASTSPATCRSAISMHGYEQASSRALVFCKVGLEI